MTFPNYILHNLITVLEISAKRTFLNLLFVFLFPSNISDRSCIYFPGDSMLFLGTTWEKKKAKTVYLCMCVCSVSNIVVVKTK